MPEGVSEISLQDRRDLTDNNSTLIYRIYQELSGAKKNAGTQLLYDFVKPLFEFLYSEHQQGRYQPDIIVFLFVLGIGCII